MIPTPVVLKSLNMPFVDYVVCDCLYGLLSSVFGDLWLWAYCLVLISPIGWNWDFEKISYRDKWILLQLVARCCPLPRPLQALLRVWVQRATVAHPPHLEFGLGSVSRLLFCSASALRRPDPPRVCCSDCCSDCCSNCCLAGIPYYCVPSSPSFTGVISNDLLCLFQDQKSQIVCPSQLFVVLQWESTKYSKYLGSHCWKHKFSKIFVVFPVVDWEHSTLEKYLLSCVVSYPLSNHLFFSFQLKKVNPYHTNPDQHLSLSQPIHLWTGEPSFKAFVSGYYKLDEILVLCYLTISWVIWLAVSECELSVWGLSLRGLIDSICVQFHTVFSHLKIWEILRK